MIGFKEWGEIKIVPDRYGCLDEHVGGDLLRSPKKREGKRRIYTVCELIHFPRPRVC